MSPQLSSFDTFSSPTTGASYPFGSQSQIHIYYNKLREESKVAHDL
jgi:hypothetical protein